MGELFSALADVLGVYLLYFIGRFAIFFCTFGIYRAAPLESNAKSSHNEKTSHTDTSRHNRVVSKKLTMIIGFFFLVLILIFIGAYFAPDNAF